jgi:signal transduction histidine kinase
MPGPVRRGVVWTAVCTVPVVALYALLTEWPRIGAGDLWPVLADVVVSSSFFATGLFIATEAQHRLTGAALVVAATLWPLNWLNEWHRGPAELVAALLGPLADLVAAWALLRYPRLWPRRRHDLTVVAAAVAIQLSCVLSVVTSRPAWHEGTRRAMPWITLWANRTAYRFADDVYNLGSAVAALAVAVVFWMRVRRLTGPDRRAMRPVWMAMILAAAITALATLTNAAHTPDPLQNTFYVFESIGLVLLPLTLLLAAVSLWLTRETVPQLIRALGDHAPTPLGIERLIQQLLADPSVRLLYPVPEGYADVHGAPVPAPPDEDPRVIATLGDAGDAVLLTGDPSLRRHQGTMASIIRSAVLILDNTRLQATLQAQLHQVRESDIRIREAVDAERQRIESAVDALSRTTLRRLDDDLSSLELAGDSPQTHTEIRSARTALRDAQQELTLLSQGLTLPLLTSSGLGPAVRLAVAGSGISVLIPDDRLDPVVETTAYFVICELAANAVKHAAAQSISVTVTTEPNRLRIDVVDDGRGGADPSGGGLRGILRRLRKLKGDLSITSRSGHGTRVTAVIPLSR